MTKSITAIINVQALEWEARRTARRRAEEVAHQRPVITISSDVGARGQTVAEGVARQLGFDLFDRELLDRIVASANASRRIVESLDERVQDWITEHLAGQFERRQFTSSDFLRHLSRVVLALGHHGRAVIVGRGAQFILDPRRTLRVRTIAPLQVRITNLARMQGVSEKEASAECARRTEERVAFARLHFDRDVASNPYYDLVINTADQPLEQAVELVAHAFRARFHAGE